MRALVVYESMFGNTRLIAEAIATGLGGDAHVTLSPVGEVEAHQLAELRPAGRRGSHARPRDVVFAHPTFGSRER